MHGFFQCVELKIVEVQTIDRRTASNVSKANSVSRIQKVSLGGHACTRSPETQTVDQEGDKREKERSRKLAADLTLHSSLQTITRGHINHTTAASPRLNLIPDLLHGFVESLDGVIGDTQRRLEIVGAR